MPPHFISEPVNPALQNTLFYTMSTIAQTLSGAMGLLGAIVLFALQGTTRGIERAAKRLLDVPHLGSAGLAMRHLYARRNFHELARQFGELLERETSLETNLHALEHHTTLSWELRHDLMLRTSFMRALTLSGVVIGLSLIACGLAEPLSAHQALGRAVLATAIIGALMCLVLYGVLLRVMLRTRDA